MANENLLRTWASQIRSAVQATGGTESLADWLISNTSSPVDPLKPWSFKDHEWQLGVLEALKTKNHVTLQKSAQVGASELSARMALALAVVGGKAVNLMYVLPSAGFARRFTSSRIDPIIRNSPILRGMLNQNLDNMDLKGIGNSFIFFAGASVVNQSISTPVNYLIFDERNFCSEAIISVFASRLGHNKPGEEIVINLSTPTLPAYAISRLYDEGSQNSYLVKHDACGQWVEVLPEAHIVVPGWEGNLLSLTKREVEQNSQINLKGAWVRCQGCGNEITQENLADPGKRQWVAKWPERDEASFHVAPTDCAAINPAPKIAGRVRAYSRQVDYVNYGLGVAAANSDAMIMMDAIERARVERAIHPNVGAAGCVAGLDIGKVSHLVIAKKAGGILRVIWVERILLDGSEDFKETVLQRMQAFGISRIVIDAQPDIGTPRAIADKCWAGRVLASYFVTGAGPKTLDLVKVDEAAAVIRINRTRAIDELVKELNSGGINLLDEHPDADMFVNHLSQLRRVEEEGIEGVRKAKWVSVTDSDHYFFALLYAFCAAHSMEDGGSVPTQVFSVANKIITKVKLRLI